VVTYYEEEIHFLNGSWGITKVTLCGVSNILNFQEIKAEYLLFSWNFLAEEVHCIYKAYGLLPYQ
jgi:hypothetical protein